MHQDAGYFPNAEVCVIPGPPDDRVSSHHINLNRLKVGFIGTHTRDKRIETLAAAAARLSDHPDILFVISGSGHVECTDELKAQLPSSNTTFGGWVHADEFYAGIDVVIVPSTWREPFGRVSIEDSCFCVLAVVARYGGLPENVEPSHDDFVFEPRDDQRLAESF